MSFRCFFYLLVSAFIAGACATPSIMNPEPQTTNPSPTLTPASVKPASASPSVAMASNDPAPTAQLLVTPTVTATPITTLLFTGNIVPARCVQAAIDRHQNYDYPYEEVAAIIQVADYAIGTFNATMSTIAPRTGCVPTFVLVGDPQNADALARAGFDAMSVATNHIKDCGLASCGDQAFFETLTNFQRVGILTVGAGKNEAEALQPIVLTSNGVRFGLVSLGQHEQGGVFAEADTPGIARLSDENISKAIQLARQVADVVIFMPHWGPEDRSTPTWIQRQLAQKIVAAGADLVVGNHTHVVQGYQMLEGVLVFYGLGNFVFDQDLNDHQQGVILIVRFQGKDLLDFSFIPTHVDEDGRVHVAKEEEAAAILQRIEAASQDLQ
ncbi:MAG: CapA family protein [Anaerolineales bacterium]